MSVAVQRRPAMGRKAGEVREALIKAVRELQTDERCPTVREMAARARVGFDSAQTTVKNLVRSGVLERVRTRQVDYRSRPVYEYGLSSGRSASFEFTSLHQVW